MCLGLTLAVYCRYSPLATFSTLGSLATSVKKSINIFRNQLTSSLKVNWANISVIGVIVK